MATAKKSNQATKAAKAAKSAAKKTTTKKAAKAAKSAAKKAKTKKATARKATAKKSAAKKATAKKATARKATAKKATAKRAAKKSVAKKATARKATAKKAAKRAKSPFGAKFIQDMKEKLLAERAKYLHSAEEYRAEAEALIDGREPGDVQFDEEGGEGDTLAVERERDLALSNQARQAVDQIDAALDRIAEGSYGLCVVSGLPIPQERLRAIPWAAERVEYKAGGLGRL